jgi:Fe-S cluster assembly ATP-binding protein
MSKLEMDKSFLSRYVNDGFSGGEKKRLEILQMLLLKPSLALLDETDSGLDIDALRIVSKGINEIAPEAGCLIITHYQRLLDHVKPHHVHAMIDGAIVKTGGPELALKLEERGYDWLDSTA